MKMRKIIALLLALCMLLSLSISAFAADDVVASGTIPDSKIKWALDSNGWLTISGSGEAPVFQSADGQPWAEYREQITEVWFEDMETLNIPDLAYWFEGCTALTTAELPLAPVIGAHAFYGCSRLSTIMTYYGEQGLKSVGTDAFWRDSDAGDTLYIGIRYDYPEAADAFRDYDWAASNRSSLHYEDVYGVSLAASVVGTCPSCKQNSLQGVYVGRTHEARGHAEYNKCYRCAYTQYLGTYVYKNHGAGTEDSWTCPSCGSHTWVLQSQQPASCTANGYADYSCV